MNPDTDQKALTLTMIGEARNQGKNGMIDVGCVVLNRVALRNWFGHTIKDVCLKPWQFSCWNEGDPNREYLLDMKEDDKLYQSTLPLANGLICKFLTDRTNGATHYRVIGTNAKWSHGLTPCFTEGKHEFYRDVP